MIAEAASAPSGSFAGRTIAASTTGSVRTSTAMRWASDPDRSPSSRNPRLARIVHGPESPRSPASCASRSPT